MSSSVLARSAFGPISIHVKIFFLALILFIFQSTAFAQSPGDGIKQSGSASIAGALNADGTLKPGVLGSFSAEGFEMSWPLTARRAFFQRVDRGKHPSPRLPIAAITGTTFFVRGTSGGVRAIARDGGRQPLRRGPVHRGGRCDRQ